MSKSLISQAETASDLYTDLVSQENTIRLMRTRVGLLLNSLKHKSLYKKAVGEGINTWRDFLAMPEIGLSESDAKALMTLAKLEDWNIPFATAKVITNKGELDAPMLFDAQTLTTKDFKERYHEVKTNDAPQTYTYLVMKKSNETGNMSKVHAITSKDIEEKFELE